MHRFDHLALVNLVKQMNLFSLNCCLNAACNGLTEDINQTIPRLGVECSCGEVLS